MSMSRNEHYRRAEDILAPVDYRVREGQGVGTMGPDLIRLAQVHATLAAAPAAVTGEVAVEAQESAPSWMTARAAFLESLPERLERALAELEGWDAATASVPVAVAFIRERVLGGGR